MRSFGWGGVDKIIFFAIIKTISKWPVLFFIKTELKGR